MAPLENGGFQPSVWAGDRSRPIDSLMRALLYVAQQVGRPVSEADIRRLAAVPAAGLDEAAFLTAGTRLGLETQALDLTPDQLASLPLPFVLLSVGHPAHVVVAGRPGQWMVLDVIDGQVWHLTDDEVMALGARALVMREKLPDAKGARWYAPLWTRVRPVILKLAAASFVINLLGLATPLFMMLMLNMVVGHAAPANAASLVMLLSAAMLVVYGLDFALRLARGWLSARTGARLDALMSGEALHHLMQLPYRHFERTPSGIIAERLRQLDVLRNFLTG